MKNLAHWLSHDTVRMLYSEKLVNLVSSAMPKDSLFDKINHAAIKFLVPQTLEETYQTIVDETVNMVGGECGTIFLKRDATLVRAYSSSDALEGRKPRKNGFTFQAIKVKKPFVISAEELYPELREQGITAELFIPLYYQKKVSGVLTIDLKRSKHWRAEEMNLLKLLGTMATLAIRKAQLHEETQQALIIRDKFISMAAHELKTPLTTITGYVQLLRKKYTQRVGKATESESQEEQWMKNLHSESSRLTDLVNEMLQVSRIRAGKLEYNFMEVNISDILSKVVDLFQTLYPTRVLLFQKTIHDKSAEIIVADKEKLAQVFCQILDNAAKFSSSDQPIKMLLRSSKYDVIIEIQDNGKGISTESMPYLFQDFHKGHEENVDRGMGLGLFLCKSIIDKHQGDISLSSQLNHGTKVQISLPKTVIDDDDGDVETEC